jgi:indole-3-glycerol phosphate synthase
MLDRIIIDKKAELARRRTDRRDFARALTAKPPAIIAEIKKASPSRGLIAADFDPPRIARAYEAGGAAAISVLTDAKHFQGSLSDLEAARAAVRLPVLRKDFTIDPFHILEAAAHDADAILLIVAVLSDRELRDYRELASGYGMAALVEVHDAEELNRAVASGAEMIGVNNRDLRTFEVRMETALELAERMPVNVVRVAESGIRTRADVRRLCAAGYHACLVGEHLMTASDPAAAVRALLE